MDGVASGGPDGIGYYTQEIYHRMAHVKRTPVVFGNLGPDFLEQEPILRLGSYPPRALLSAMTGADMVGSAALKERVDLFHAPDHFVPKLKGIPVVATLHDSIPLSHPAWVSQRFRRSKNWLWRQAANWADHVMTVSEFSKGEIVRYFGVPESRISVTPAGVDDRFFERLKGPEVDEVVRQLGLPERFFLFVGTLQPRKNVERILDAHLALPAKIRRDVPLIIVGRHGWGSDHLLARLKAMGPDDHVRWLSGIDDFTKRVMMQKATALLFPSLFEGFGLPVLEGFASNTPVITSNVSSLPEVAGDAAWMVDPYDVTALTDAMATLIRETVVADDLVAKGLMRARQFSWDACAAKTLKVYESVLS